MVFSSKNTGVGCHFLLQGIFLTQGLKLDLLYCICVCIYIYCCCCLVTDLYPTLLRPHGLYPFRFFCSWDFPSKNTGVGCYFLLQRIFPSLELNPHVLHWQADSLSLSMCTCVMVYILLVLYYVFLR